jgi:uncharacterized integral membrane protein
MIKRLIHYILFGFFAFIETLEFFFQEIRPPFSMLNAKRFEIVYVHHVYKRLKHDLFHISPGIIPRRWPPYQHETQSRVYMGRGMIAGMIWKMSCINLFIIYIQKKPNNAPNCVERFKVPTVLMVMSCSVTFCWFALHETLILLLFCVFIEMVKFNYLKTIILKPFLIIVFTSILHLFYRIILFFHDSICAHLTFSSSTNNFAQTLFRMCSLSGRMNIARVNIEFFTGFKKIKQRRISFVLCYLRMIIMKNFNCN